MQAVINPQEGDGGAEADGYEEDPGFCIMRNDWFLQEEHGAAGPEKTHPSKSKQCCPHAHLLLHTSIQVYTLFTHHILYQ